ncbi:hypothetical protein JL2886_02098 [Phaeobacter gallaeciensis]|uniref:Uncharacterized protein n=1 Tax=Phaeobacter gallaeciensis TaxID=60890 RepID=A0A1B0ZS63_9RHOB|nr:hypothetical protein JL2886_02098 [Phaeobacter gallaeciensis]
MPDIFIIASIVGSVGLRRNRQESNGHFVRRDDQHDFLT